MLRFIFGPWHVILVEAVGHVTEIFLKETLFLDAVRATNQGEGPVFEMRQDPLLNPLIVLRNLLLAHLSLWNQNFFRIGKSGFGSARGALHASRAYGAIQMHLRRRFV